MISDREPLHVPVWSPGCPLWRILTGILCPPGWVSTEKGEMQWKGTLTLWRKKEAHPPPVDMMQVSLPPFFLHTTFSPISAFTYNIPSSYSFNLSSFFKRATLLFTFACAGSSLMHELSLVVVSGGCSRVGVRVSLQRLLLLQGTGSRLAGFRCCSSQPPEQLAQ